MVALYDVKWQSMEEEKDLDQKGVVVEEEVEDMVEEEEIEAEAATIVMVDVAHHLVMMIEDITEAAVTMAHHILPHQVEVITAEAEVVIHLHLLLLMVGTALHLSRLTEGMAVVVLRFLLVLLFQTTEE